MSNIKKITQLLLIPMILFAALTSSAHAFSDVESDDKYYVAITYLEEQGIIDGYEDGTFKAHEYINRAEALKIITLATGIFSEEEISEDFDKPFTDTPKLDWYTKYINAAKEKGIIDGYYDGTFRPNRTINLVETLKIYLESAENIKYKAFDEYFFADTPADAWYTKYTEYAGEYGIININPENKIFPDQEMTRGYLTEVIYRMLKAQEGFQFGKATFYGSAVQGNYTASGEIFDMNKLTAAHKYLPFGTIVKVTNLANGKSVSVKINDRGPYGHGRVLDLSSGAFSEIAWLGTGIIFVQYEITFLP